MDLEILVTSLDRAWEFFEKGGVLAWPILFCSLIALTVIIDRWWAYRKLNRAGEDWFEGILDLVDRSELSGVSEALADIVHPSARVLGALLEKYRAMGRFSRGTLEKLAGHQGTREVQNLERYLPALATIGNIAPLLGLTGTVLGMVKAFMKIEDLQGKVDASVLAGGIWEALLTTLFGLAVAIPAVIAHSYLSARVSRTAAEVQDHAITFVDALEELDQESPAQEPEK